jgi:hypothetical protein
MSTRSPDWKIYLTSFALLSGLIFIAKTIFPFIAAFMFIGPSTPFDDRSFERDVWIAADDPIDPDNPRGLMAADLGIRLMAARSTYRETIDVLGRPDSLIEGRFARYFLGMWSGLRFDYDTFDISFDSTGHVSTIAIVQH